MQYKYMMEIPVTVLYSKRDDGSISIDMVDVPDGDEIYGMVDAHAKEIKNGAKKETAWEWKEKGR